MKKSGHQHGERTTNFKTGERQRNRKSQIGYGSTDKGEKNEQTLETVKSLGPELICVTHCNIAEDHFKQNHGAAFETMR